MWKSRSGKPLFSRIGTFAPAFSGVGGLSKKTSNEPHAPRAISITAIQAALVNHGCLGAIDVKSPVPLLLLRNTNRVSSLLGAIVLSLREYEAPYFPLRACGNGRCALPAPCISFQSASWLRILEQDLDLREGCHFSTMLIASASYDSSSLSPPPVFSSLTCLMFFWLTFPTMACPPL